MKLDPGEQSILAYFVGGPDAEGAAVALKEAGYAEVQVDRIGRFGSDIEPNQNRPALGGEASQVSATLFGSELHDRDDDERVLLAAMPEASGLSGPITADDRSFLVTVVTDSERIPEAVAIIENHGGRV